MPYENVVFVARKGVLHKKELISQGVSGSQVDLEELQELTNSEPIVDTSTQPKVEIPFEPNNIYLPLHRFVSNSPEFYSFRIMMEGNTLINDRIQINLDEPTSYKEAMVGCETVQRKEATDNEFQSIMDDKVWNLVDPTPSFKTVGCKYVFKKNDMDRNEQTFKSMMVSKGFSQALIMMKYSHQ